MAEPSQEGRLLAAFRAVARLVVPEPPAGVSDPTQRMFFYRTRWVLVLSAWLVLPLVVFNSTHGFPAATLAGAVAIAVFAILYGWLPYNNTVRSHRFATNAALVTATVCLIVADISDGSYGNAWSLSLVLITAGYTIGRAALIPWVLILASVLIGWMSLLSTGNVPLRQIPPREALVTQLMVLVGTFIFTYLYTRTHQLQLSELREQAALISAQTADLARDEERRALAIDLHDELAQYLTLARWEVGDAAEALGVGESPSREQVESWLGKVGRHVDECNVVLRNLMTSLRDQRSTEPGELDDLLRKLCRSFTALHDIPVEIEISVPDRTTLLTLAKPVQAVILRNVREALQNVRKHAGASRAEVRLSWRNGELHTRVSDDGQGFDPAEAATQGGFGLVTMREAVASLGGRMSVSSSAAGTKIDFSFPAAS